MTRAIQEADKEIGKRVRRARQAAGLTQVEMAKRVGISPQQLQKYERGENKVSASRLASIAQMLHLPVLVFYDDIAQAVNAPKLADRNTLRLVQAYESIHSPALRKLLIKSADVYAGED